MMMMMQAAATLSSSSPQVCTGVLGSSVVNTRAVSQKYTAMQQRITSIQRSRCRLLSLRTQAEPTESSGQYVDYEGRTSVFPAEACEETGENCDTEGVGKEVANSASATSSPAAEEQSGPDREYEEYSGAKTVFPGEACEELGGEFCDPEFQEGVYPEKVQASKK